MDAAPRALTPDEQAERRLVEELRRIHGAKRRLRFAQELSSTQAALVSTELPRLSPAEREAYRADKAADVVYLVRGLRLTLERGKVRRYRADLERIRAKIVERVEEARAFATLGERFTGLLRDSLALESEVDELIAPATERERALTAEIEQVEEARRRAERERAHDPLTAKVQRIDKRAFFAAIDRVVRPPCSLARTPFACMCALVASTRNVRIAANSAEPRRSVRR